MVIQFILFIVAIVLAYFGASFLVDGSTSIAKKSGISEFVIGLTIVGIGTSTPEMAVSFWSSIQGNADVAVGNIIGSNIYNTAFILGVTALISPITIKQSDLRFLQIWVNFIAALLLVILSLSHTILHLGTDGISRICGAIFVALFVFYVSILFRRDNGDVDTKSRDNKQFSTLQSILCIIFGLVMLIIAGKFFVDSASKIAAFFHVSDAFIAIVVVALGTSLPELATCVVAAFRGRNQLALGNILGSNISNILLIIGGSALIRPLVANGITMVDYVMIVCIAIFLILCAYMFRKKQIDRAEGAILVLLEIGYLVWLIIHQN